jgi:hypothetical protein
MELYALRTADTGRLLPCFPEDAERIERLQRNKPYLITISESRNIRLHRKYFALINIAWGACGEEWRKRFRNTDNFRRSITMLAGYTDPVYNPRTEEWIETPRSISFECMSEQEFERLYEDTLRIIREQFIPRNRLAREAFEEELKTF